MSMFRYALANQSPAVQQDYERSLRRLIEWAWRCDRDELVLEAVDVVQEAVYACAALSFQEYQRVCGAAALLAYVADEADDGFWRLREFFRSVPGLFQVDWSGVQEPVAVVGYGYGE